VTSLLQGVVDEGTGRAVRSAGIRGPVAGKTGTTNDGTDVWFVGYTPTLVASVWFGADTPEPLGWNASGGRLAAPAWARFLRDGWHSPQRDTPWQAPPGIESQRIDIATGALASEWCGPSRREYFRTGTAPTASCEADAYYAARDTDGPDWQAGDIDVDDLDAAVQAIMDATNQRGRAREIADRVLREMKRATDKVRRKERQ
jgi:penicillin-binding protein 1A